MVSTVLAYDAIGAGVAHLPPGQHAGYTTGSGGIAWSAAQFASSPGCVRIDQDYLASDHTADVLDVENGAATPAECPAWVKAALANYRSAARPGQRSPAIYCNGSTLTAVCNSLLAGGVTSANIWLANWSLSAVAAADLVARSAPPWLIVGCQFSDAGLWDVSVFSVPWLNATSGDGSQPVISAGASGPAVSLAQTRLNVWGAHLTVDGQFGPATSAAVAVFQGQHALIQDGTCGPLTWAALNANPAPPAYQVTAPPGWWKTGTTGTFTGTGTDGAAWKTSFNGSAWSAPVKG